MRVLMAQPVVALNTARGSIEIARADASARCVTKGCRTLGGGLAEVTVNMDAKPYRLFICGNCMARAMALTISPEVADA